MSDRPLLMWDSIIGAGIGAVSNLAGGMISSAGAADRNAMSWQQMQAQQQFAREQSAWSAEQAQKQMDFQERMSNTQYQRGMADMRAAGLNPILAYSQGGASSPAGAIASAQGAGGAQFENAMEGLGHGVASAGQFARSAADLQLVKEQANNTAAQVPLNQAQEVLAKANAVKTAQDTATSAADEKRKLAETALTIEQMDNPKAARALMGAQSHSARASGDLSDEQRKQLQEAGPGWIGQNVLSPIGRIWDRLSGAYSTGTLTSPTDPRFWGRRGRPGSGPGLVIDVKRR